MWAGGGGSLQLRELERRPQGDQRCIDGNDPPVYIATVPAHPKRSFNVNETRVRSFYRKTDHGMNKFFDPP